MDKITLDYSIENAVNIGYIKELKAVTYREVKHTAYPTLCEYTEYVPVISTQEVTSGIGDYTVTVNSWQLSAITNQVNTFSLSSGNFSLTPQNTTTSVFSMEEE